MIAIQNPSIQVVDTGTAQIRSGQNAVTGVFKTSSRTGDILLATKQETSDTQAFCIVFNTVAGFKLSVPNNVIVNQNFYWALLREV